MLLLTTAREHLIGIRIGTQMMTTIIRINVIITGIVITIIIIITSIRTPLTRICRCPSDAAVATTASAVATAQRRRDGLDRCHSLLMHLLAMVELLLLLVVVRSNRGG